MIVNDLAWISDLSDRNLLGLIDVLLDVRDELETGVQEPQIRIIPAAIRFLQLFPADSPANRDHYGRQRWSIAEMLQQRGILLQSVVVGEGHRWQQRIRVRAELPRVYAALEAASRERDRRPSLRIRRRRLLDRRTWISLTLGTVLATGAWLILDYLTPNHSRHFLEASLFALIATAGVLIVWPIIQNVIGSAIWDLLSGRRR